MSNRENSHWGLTLRTTRGFTLVETLAAITLIMVAIVAPMGLTVQSLSVAYYARDQITASNLAQEGIEAVKLYFMIGLPTETDEDLLAIGLLAEKIMQIGRSFSRRPRVTVNLSTFIPKPHTPFQWEPQISYEDILEKQQILRHELKKKKLHFKWQDAPLSVLEGVFARGDRRLGRVLLKARELGCRFDGWGEHFNFAKWQEAFRAGAICHATRSARSILKNLPTEIRRAR